ncbi:MAG: pseudouridine synthase, partial [Bdellovibrionota bacterium]
MALERVQKILAQAGIASRRKAEELIQLGEVTINGKVAKLGDKAEFGKDAIKVKGKLLTKTEAPIYLAFYKPRGVISMLADPEGRATLMDFLEKVKTRVYPIGRLDFNSEGLILLTNDGALTEALQKRDDIPRVYHVKVKGHPDPEMLKRIERGVRVGEVRSRLVKPHSVRVARDFQNKSAIEVVMMGAGAFDIKSLFDLTGFLVERITRTAIGHITLKGLEPGQYRQLKPTQAKALLDQPELGMKRLEQEATKARPADARRERIRVRSIQAEERTREARDKKFFIVRPKGEGRPSVKPRPAGRSGSSRPASGGGGPRSRIQI